VLIPRRDPSGSISTPRGAPRINPAGQLAHDHQIETGDELALEARRVGERIEHHRRTQIGEQIHFLAQPRDAALDAARTAADPISPRRRAPNSTASLASALARVASASGVPQIS
jgi:hypothetical protein